ncbi:MAG: hypothetical protein N2C12_13735, partial [Planctomycetales bacterium]
MKRLVLAAVAACCGLVAIGAFPEAAYSTVYYNVTDLGFGSGGAPVINNNLQIAGNHVVAGKSQGLLWEGGVITNLGTLPGEQESSPYDINDAGQIVGGFGAWMWDNGTMTDLGTLPGDVLSHASGINNSGQVVGYSFGVVVRDRAFIWQAGVMTDLGTLGYASSAYAINNSGQVVGMSRATYDEPDLPILWENGVMTTLDVIQGKAVAVDINDSGQAVGSGETAA